MGNEITRSQCDDSDNDDEKFNCESYDAQVKHEAYLKSDAYKKRQLF